MKGCQNICIYGIKLEFLILISDETVFTETIIWRRNNGFEFSLKENNRLLKTIWHRGVNSWWKFSKIHLADFSEDFVAPILIARRSLFLGLIGRLSFIRIDDGFKYGVIILRYKWVILTFQGSIFGQKRRKVESEKFIFKMKTIFFDHILDILCW